jgi:hypothetical protein
VFGLGIHPILILLSFHLMKGLFFILLLPWMWLFKIQTFITWWFCCLGPPTWVKGRPYLLTSMQKHVFVVQVSTKQPFSHISVDASIDLALPPWPFLNPTFILHTWFNGISIWSLSCETTKAPTRTTFKIKWRSNL